LRVSQPELLFSTSECFKASKQLVGTISAEIPKLDPDVVNMNAEDARNLAKICIGNAVYVQKLSQLIATKATTTATAEFDFQTQKSLIARPLCAHNLGGMAQAEINAVKPSVAIQENGQTCDQDDERKSEAYPIIGTMHHKQDDPHGDEQVMKCIEATEVCLTRALPGEVPQSKDHHHEQVPRNSRC